MQLLQRKNQELQVHLEHSEWHRAEADRLRADADRRLQREKVIAESIVDGLAAGDSIIARVRAAVEAEAKLCSDDGSRSRSSKEDGSSKGAANAVLTNFSRERRKSFIEFSATFPLSPVARI